MKVIKTLAKQIVDEVEGVEGYAKCALTYRGVDDNLANLYHRLAETEYEHVERLHEAVVRKIEELGEVEVPAKMRAKWDKQHHEIIDKMATAKMYLNLW